MNKQIILLSLAAVSLNIDATDWYDGEDYDPRFTTALTAGYVFKHDDCRFKEVYGHGIVNVLTADGCYYFCNPWGIGAKISYWRAKGCTSFLKQCSLLQEVPITVYFRRLKLFECGLELYASLGGGVIWSKEKSYLGEIKIHKGVGEVEAGLSYNIWRCVNITSAFRYLFPRQKYCGEKIDIGGFDLRAGFEFTF